MPKFNPNTQLIGSLLEDIPGINYIQSKFDLEKSHIWLHNNWYWSIICSAIYLILLWYGHKWMSKRPAFNLRPFLVAWNIGLFLFSIMGTLSIVPNFIHSIIVHGVDPYTVCRSDTLMDPHQGLWGFLFIWSKVIEFGDTAFIILRKTPLQFLHWYHHVTVCIYSWYGLSQSKSAIGEWFAAMNFTVHSVMYGYYALKAARIHVPSYIAQVITLMQISQMFVAIYANVMNFTRSRELGNDACESNRNVFIFGMIVYGSYAILFLKFFYEKYCAKKAKKH